MSEGFAIVVAADEGRGIGYQGDLPWRIARDMKFFRELTKTAPEGKQNAVIMGRKTYASLAERFRPLPGRLNVVLSRSQTEAPPGALLAASLDAAQTLLAERTDVHRHFVIGGAGVYAQALRDPRCAQVFITRVHANFECDVYLAPFEQAFERTFQDGPHREGDLSFTFETYQRLS